MTYREALRLAMREEMLRDPRVFVMGEEVGVFDGAYKVTAGLLEEFGPDRVRDTPISEEGFVGAGVGAAMLGERPIVEIMTINFLLVAMDQVVNHAAKIGAMFGGEVRCPLVIRTPNGAGNQLTAQHSQSFEGWFAATPGLKVVAPASPADAKGLLKAAIRDDDPVLVVENLAIYKEHGEVPLDPEFVTPIGLAAVAREGSDVTLVAHAFATVRALHVAERLERSTASAPRSSTCARCARSTSRPSPRRSPRPAAPSASRRAGRPTASPPRSPRASSAPASTTSTRRSSASAWPRCRCPTPRSSRTPRCPTRTASRPPCSLRWGAAVTDIVMPRLSDSMEEGTILKWLKATGEEVRRRRGDRRDRDRQGDDDLRGRRRRLPADRCARGRHARDRRGHRAPGCLRCRGRRPGRGRGRERPPRPKRSSARAPSRPRRRAGAVAPAASGGRAEAPPPRSAGARIKASPVARRIARELGVDLARVRGSGPEGRIVKADVVAAGNGAAGAGAAPRGPADGDEAARRARSR